VLLAPGMGDGVQAAKAGVLEIGDVFVVNKSDREGAQALVRDLRGMIALGARAEAEWRPVIVSTVASEGHGITELVAAIDRHRNHALADGSWQERRLGRARAEVEALALATLRARFTLTGRSGLGDLARAVRDGNLDPYTAADLLTQQ
jgi:LAO/AO transport system kinase